MSTDWNPLRETGHGIGAVHLRITTGTAAVVQPVVAWRHRMWARLEAERLATEGRDPGVQ